MITCDMQGGLGNIMFQIATAWALAKKNNGESYFDLSKNISCVTKHFNNLSEYKENIFHKLNDKKTISHKNHYTEPHFHYTPIPYKEDLFIHGYFQSELYFKHFRKEILDIFSLPESIQNYIKNKYSYDFSKCVSIHVRRGDYTKLQHIHPIQSIDYYRNSIAAFPSNTLFLCFSDDIKWCKENLKKSNIIFIENNKDWEDLYLMSKCIGNIICNSTFSWWGAWLNKTENKKVVAPSKWFGPAISHDIKDLYPSEWIII